MNKSAIAKAFSNGDFETTYGFIAENAVWMIIEEDRHEGKQAIINKCEQVAGYFKSVTTDFKTIHVITEGNKVVINGTAAFSRDNTPLSFISACDIYEFNEQDQIQTITSYCIDAK